ncbi:unnamed protein product [Adineta steineri]|uniref:Uncharacterized protein n=1 Tax=Adineta steineri TaxID=433720 RepID=A0A813SE96_9BILA|nr:unnamed protein product [Adineta steineri]CAF0795814.1 unnamed protein product [Adineta steineri]
MIFRYNTTSNTVTKSPRPKVDLLQNLNKLPSKTVSHFCRSDQVNQRAQVYNQTESIIMMTDGLTSIQYKIPTAEQTMRHKRFNKIAPFHTHMPTPKRQIHSNSFSKN